MGITIGIHYSTTKDSSGVEKCVPTTLYRPFRGRRATSAGADDLVMEFRALPTKCYPMARPSNIADAYWWTDAEFLPNNDSVLFVASGAFCPRTNQAWIHIKNIPRGRIVRYQFGYENTGGEIFAGSSMSNYPKVQMHPSGQYIGYTGAGELIVETVAHDTVLAKQKDMRMCNYKFCAFSPNGKHLAILLSVSRRFELLISVVEKASTFHDRVIDISRTFKGFEGSVAYNEHLECKWSPDSQNIAVCSSIRFLVVLDSALAVVADVFEDILPNSIFPSNAGTFDFDPRSCHETLAVGASDRRVYVVNTHSKEVVLESELGDHPIDCLRYNPTGTKIGISLRDFTIVLIDTYSGEVTFQIDMRERCSDIPTPYIHSFPSVMRLSFTSTGDKLATSSSDGFVRIWQLPVEISLRRICQFAVLGVVPPSKVQQLHLPTKLKEELLAFPVLE